MADQPLPLPGNRTILIGIDSITKHGLQSSPVLSWALRQFLVPGDSIVVVHASKSLETSISTGFTNTMSPELLKSLEKDVETTVREMARSAFGFEKGQLFKVRAHVVKGDPRETIKGLANEDNATAVIVGRRGSVGAVKRALLGSVSDYLARELQSTVIIVKGD
ncbi:uncharacterized protein EV422DRAFT_515587 [Fimicolochytrium jonesii]|uniref:uncharacterized protein n=1 Tax=Fimicolochytrium jonesii TaxID=1396493 RepID=UPI0022FE49D8|nr:uncharacterized protein EV422DRAFT_515587 [Fimicolochytrium jonesii]KAI8826162.1 hypothetical protein EV422DRAFT_515587 [Fimicolochytrium jonesii]